MEQAEFLKDVSTWNNHLPLLWMALEMTKGCKLPVIEWGAGSGSTPYLRQYCQDDGREFFSYDSNKEWAEKCGSIYIENWNNADIYKPSSVILVDESPGLHRHETMAIMKDRAEIIVVHDSEINGCGQYFFEKVWPLFKFRVNINKTGGGAGASMVSNKIDLNFLLGNKVGDYIIEP